MKHGLVCRVGIAVALVAGLAVSANAAQNPDSGKQDKHAASPRCVGCSVDGKTTPRTFDGHPDFSGFYNRVDVYHGDAKTEKPGQPAGS